MYELLFLLTDPATASVSKLRDAILLQYAGLARPRHLQVDSTAEVLTVRIEEFSFRIDLDCAPHVREESEEIAHECAANHPARSSIASAASRFVLTSDDDPDMDYFNDLLFLTEAVESLGGVHVFDPQDGEFQQPS